MSETAFEVHLERPAGFTFEAGQSIRVYLGDEGRDYSLAGGPSEDRLTLVVRRIEGGAISPRLTAAAPGTPIDFTGPHGVFTLRPSPRPMVMVAASVGIAPFLSMLLGATEVRGATQVRRATQGTTLLHGVRARDELFYSRKLEAAAAFYVPCLSRERSAGCFFGRVTEWARTRLSGGPFDFYLCGGRSMVRDMTLLVDDRFPGSRVYTEIFF